MSRTVDVMHGTMKTNYLSLPQGKTEQIFELAGFIGEVQGSIVVVLNTHKGGIHEIDCDLLAGVDPIHIHRHHLQNTDFLVLFTRSNQLIINCLTGETIESIEYDYQQPENALRYVPKDSIDGKEIEVDLNTK